VHYLKRYYDNLKMFNTKKTWRTDICMENKVKAYYQYFQFLINLPSKNIFCIFIST